MSGATQPTLIPVLLYHRVAEAGHDQFAVSRQRFAEHLQVIAASGRVPLTIGELAAGLRRRASLPPRAMAITFDDGYADTPAALDALGAAGLRATLYVTAGSLDTAGSLSRDQLRALSQREGEVELGAHSITHPHLDSIPRPAMHAEIAHSKQTLESEIGRRINTFAYPHGAYDTAVREAVIGAGFTSAAAVKNAISHTADDSWAVARYTVTNADSQEQLAAVLDGRGAPLAWQSERVRTRAARAARRARSHARRLRPFPTKPIPHI
jgi:peptidoglycan/xylan/chitin deacetylase (PgdA/CDA1 family)